MPRDTIAVLPDTATPTASNCHSCVMQKLCLPPALERSEIGLVDSLIRRRRRLVKGDTLYQAGEVFSALYAVRYGHFKTFQINAAGDEQITAFQMAGDLLGMQGIGAGRHAGHTMALDDVEVCEIPFALLEDLLLAVPSLMRHFHRAMGQDIMREQNSMLLLGGMKAEQKLAVFLTLLSARYAARGYAAERFTLRMSREELGNHLGLTIESISRQMTRFRRDGLLAVDKREITLLDLPRLKRMAQGHAIQ